MANQGTPEAEDDVMLDSDEVLVETMARAIENQGTAYAEDLMGRLMASKTLPAESVGRLIAKQDDEYQNAVLDAWVDDREPATPASDPGEGNGGGNNEAMSLDGESGDEENSTSDGNQSASSSRARRRQPKSLAWVQAEDWEDDEPEVEVSTRDNDIVDVAQEISAYTSSQAASASQSHSHQSHQHPAPALPALSTSQAPSSPRDDTQAAHHDSEGEVSAASSDEPPRKGVRFASPDQSSITTIDGVETDVGVLSEFCRKRLAECLGQAEDIFSHHGLNVQADFFVPCLASVVTWVAKKYGRSSNRMKHLRDLFAENLAFLDHTYLIIRARQICDILGARSATASESSASGADTDKKLISDWNATNAKSWELAILKASTAHRCSVRINEIATEMEKSGVKLGRGKPRDQVKNLATKRFAAKEGEKFEKKWRDIRYLGDLVTPLVEVFGPGLFGILPLWELSINLIRGNIDKADSPVFWGTVQDLLCMHEPTRTRIKELCEVVGLPIVRHLQGDAGADLGSAQLALSAFEKELPTPLSERLQRFSTTDHDPQLAIMLPFGDSQIFSIIHAGREFRCFTKGILHLKPTSHLNDAMMHAILAVQIPADWVVLVKADLLDDFHKIPEARSGWVLPVSTRVTDPARGSYKHWIAVIIRKNGIAADTPYAISMYDSHNSDSFAKEVERKLRRWLPIGTGVSIEKKHCNKHKIGRNPQHTDIDEEHLSIIDTEPFNSGIYTIRNALSAIRCDSHDPWIDKDRCRFMRIIYSYLIRNQVLLGQFRAE